MSELTDRQRQAKTNDADFREQVIEDLAELRTHMESLIGNGQPGRIAKIEDRVFWLIIAVIAIVLTGGASALPALGALLH